MKKLVLAFMMGAAAMAANAQVNYKVQTARSEEHTSELQSH